MEIQEKVAAIIRQLEYQIFDELHQDPRFTGSMSFVFNIYTGGISGDVEVKKKKKKISIGDIDITE
jgi:hypothetical protein